MGSSTIRAGVSRRQRSEHAVDQLRIRQRAWPQPDDRGTTYHLPVLSFGFFRLVPPQGVDSFPHRVGRSPRSTKPRDAWPEKSLARYMAEGKLVRPCLLPPEIEVETVETFDGVEVDPGRRRKDDSGYFSAVRGLTANRVRPRRAVPPARPLPQPAKGRVRLHRTASCPRRLRSTSSPVHRDQLLVQ
jgi:hypothetical protein